MSEDSFLGVDPLRGIGGARGVEADTIIPEHFRRIAFIAGVAPAEVRTQLAVRAQHSVAVIEVRSVSHVLAHWHGGGAAELGKLTVGCPAAARNGGDCGVDPAPVEARSQGGHSG
jgi:hypothetical protein